jgi:hypothetical protein
VKLLTIGAGPRNVVGLRAFCGERLRPTGTGDAGPGSRVEDREYRWSIKNQETFSPAAALTDRGCVQRTSRSMLYRPGASIFSKALTTAALQHFSISSTESRFQTAAAGLRHSRDPGISRRNHTRLHFPPLAHSLFSRTGSRTVSGCASGKIHVPLKTSGRGR